MIMQFNPITTCKNNCNDPKSYFILSTIVDGNFVTLITLIELHDCEFSISLSLNLHFTDHISCVTCLRSTCCNTAADRRKELITGPVVNCCEDSNPHDNIDARCGMSSASATIGRRSG